MKSLYSRTYDKHDDARNSSERERPNIIPNEKRLVSLNDYCSRSSDLLLRLCLLDKQWPGQFRCIHGGFKSMSNIINEIFWIFNPNAQSNQIRADT